ncbi:MAG: nucleotidyltransferase domain-containing protein [Deltaproteobacteria bacterium]|nr:nucleotidyltransferase domain-containing protein [Deltaproteobacteria bacterium]
MKVQNQERRKLLEEELQRILTVLIREYKPTRVYLFGSLASPRVHDWSDIDLIIIKETNRRFLDRIGDVLVLLKPRVGCDIVVYTPAEFDEMKTRKFFKTEVDQHGKILYEAA